MSILRLIAPAEDIEAMYARIDAARTLLPKDDARTADQQRADLLVDAVLAGIPLAGVAEQPRPGTHHPRHRVGVHPARLRRRTRLPRRLRDLSTPTPPERSASTRPAPGSGSSPTPPPGNSSITAGRNTAHHKDLTDHVIARDAVCVAPGCNRKAETCDVDHCTPWEEGGETCPNNLAPLCSRHHRWGAPPACGGKTFAGLVLRHPTRWVIPLDQPHRTHTTSTDHPNAGTTPDDQPAPAVAAHEPADESTEPPLPPPLGLVAQLLAKVRATQARQNEYPDKPPF